MKHFFYAAAALLFLITCAPPATPQSAGGTPALTYVPGSSVKLYQINGDCDWVVWDATIKNKTPTCKPTTSQTATKADILGDDVATSFENNGELIMMFGDTIGANTGYFPMWIGFQNTFAWNAHDPIAHSTTQHAEDGLLLNFFLGGNHALEVLPPPQPNGAAVDMGPNNLPDAGISLNGQIYISAKTGTVTDGMGNSDGSNAHAVLVKFDETSQTFTSGRTTSALPGHFVTVAWYEAPVGSLGNPAPVAPEPDVVTFGLGEYRASNIYLSVISASEFESGVDSSGNSATRYFTGLSKGQPTWSQTESDSVPVVTDIDPANPTIGNLSAFYSQQLGLWLMTFDGGRGSEGSNGTYFTYAPQPWGPWSTPQLIFNGCRDKALGNFIFYYYATAAGNACPSAMPAGVTSAPNSAGPAGPTINFAVNNPQTTKGGAYAPLMVERFTEIAGNTLKIFYTLSTWNPYAAVLMESDFTITPAPQISPGGIVIHAGTSAAVSPGALVDIYGANLAATAVPAPAGASLPLTLGAAQVLVNNIAAPLIYVSPAQIIFQLPYGVALGTASVVVVSNGAVSAAAPAAVQQAAPYILTYGSNRAVVVNPDGSVNGSPPSNGAKPGAVMVAYLLGSGPLDNPIPTGAPASAMPLSRETLTTIVTVGNSPATVQFAGMTPTYEGLMQINFVMPNVPPGDYPMQVTIGTAASNQPLITVSK